MEKQSTHMCVCGVCVFIVYNVYTMLSIYKVDEDTEQTGFGWRWMPADRYIMSFSHSPFSINCLREYTMSYTYFIYAQFQAREARHSSPTQFALSSSLSSSNQIGCPLYTCVSLVLPSFAFMCDVS